MSDKFLQYIFGAIAVIGIKFTKYPYHVAMRRIEVIVP